MLQLTTPARLVDPDAAAGFRPSAVVALPLLFSVGMASSAPAQELRHEERVEVARVLVDARVLDGRGHPILGLGADDFRVRVGGQSVRLESVQWVSSGGDAPQTTSPVADAPGASLTRDPAPVGRLVVLFFQKSLHPSRAPGTMKMLAKARELVDTLHPADRIAVLSFDSHLKLWADFTRERQHLDHVLARSILFDRHPAEGRWQADPSLAGHFDGERARRAATPERALRVTAEALQSVPGTKSLVLFGYGFGRLTGGMVRMEPDYASAREALLAARVAVFALDVTNADYHSLEHGLQNVAWDTGGFYARTHVFADAAMTRLQQALAGHYVLIFEKPDLPGQVHSISIDLVGRRGTVLATRHYIHRLER